MVVSLAGGSYGSNVHGMTFISPDGFNDKSVYVGTNAYGLDVESLFDHADLIILTDATIQRISSTWCDGSQGFFRCISGGCYKEAEKCDGEWNCRDGTDEGHCNPVDHFYDASVNFRRTRFNHIDRTYAFECCWTDGNVSPEGHFITTVCYY